VDAITPSETRLRAVLEAGMAISSELSLEALLQRVVETAASLTGARYAALGVIDRTGSQLERFVTTGIDDETHRLIGDLPRGRGILGVLIRDASPLRLHDLSEDPRSVGFPPGHPPMRTFLGVPVLLRGVAYGNLYLTEKGDGDDFTVEDQEIVSLLASQAAVAIENARLYEATTQWSTQLESLNEIGNALATETDLERLLELIVRRLRELLDARLVTVLLPAGDADLRFVAVAGEGADELIGQTMRRASSKSGRVFERGSSERSDSVLDDPEVDHEVVRRLGARTGLWVPLVRARANDRTDRRPRQARPRCSVHGQRPPARGDLRDAGRGRGGPLPAHRARRAAACGRRAGARTPAASARVARRDGSGAHVDTARAQDR
jgi:GAF domain-containing protein